MKSSRSRVAVCALVVLLSCVADGGVVVRAAGPYAGTTYGSSCKTGWEFGTYGSGTQARPANGVESAAIVRCNLNPPTGATADAVMANIAAATGGPVNNASGLCQWRLDTSPAITTNCQASAGDDLTMLRWGDLHNFAGTMLVAGSHAGLADNFIEFRLRWTWASGSAGYNMIDSGLGVVCFVSSSCGNSSQLSFSGTGSPLDSFTGRNVPVFGITDGGSGQAAWASTTLGYPEYWSTFGDVASPPPTCLELGIEYETRAQGVGNEWEPVTDLSDWPELEFGDAIRWSLTLDGGTYDTPSQIDYLHFIQRGHTPIRNTGPVGYFLNYRLSPMDDNLLDESPGPDGEPIGQQLAKGAGVHWPIRPGSSEAQQVAPYTHTGTFLYLGDSGKEPDFFVACRQYGSGMENFGKDGDAGGSNPVCSALRIIPWAAGNTSTDWGYRVQTVGQANTPLQTLEYRYKPGGVPPSDWVVILDYSPTGDGELNETISIPNVYDDGTTEHEIEQVAMVEWRCTATAAGGGTTSETIDTSTQGGLGEESAESCWTEGLGEMSLTSPVSWVRGLGRMGVCVVEWLFVPDSIGDEFESLVGELETQFPFSLGFVLVDFGAELGSELGDPSGTGCFDLGGEFSFGFFSVDVDDICIGDGMTVSVGTRQLLAALMIAPILFAVCRHALRTVRGVSTSDSGDDS